MKKKFFIFITCLFLGISSVNINNSQASSTMSIISDILGALYGDKGAEAASKALFDCDDWEDISVTNTIQSLFTSDKKDGACLAAGMLQSVGMAIGAIKGGAIGAALGNLAAQGAIVFYVWMSASKSEKKANTYHICLDTEEDNHPLPYTDKQIAYLLKLSNKRVSIENIMAQYKKICLYNSETGEYNFYGEGDEVNGVYISHANHYSYVMCASIIDSCPCIYNVQHGKIKDPEYERNDDGSIKMENGELVYKNKEDYQQHYAKHCRIIRYKDLFEQTNDLSNIIDPSCNNLRGYAKAPITMSGVITQCVEGTARNIFEKPIFRSDKFTKPAENLTEQYVADVKFIEKQISNLKNIIGSRTITMIKDKKQPSFNNTEKKEFSNTLNNMLYNKNITKTISYDCSSPITDLKYKFTAKQTSIYDKYIENPTSKPNVYCCVYETQTNPYTHTTYTEREIVDKGVCFSNNINSEDKNYSILTSTSTASEDDKNYFLPPEDQDYSTLTDEDIFLLYNSAIQLKSDIKKLQDKSSKVASIVGNDAIIKTKIQKWTLFDLFRNNIKMVAVFFICFWIFLFGFKAITGDLKLKADQIITQIIPFLLVCFFVFNDSVKNKLFDLTIKTTQGAIKAVNHLFYDIRSDNTNTIKKKCEFGNTYAYSPVKTYINKDNPEIIPVNQECSQSTTYPLKESCYEKDANGICTKKQCLYYKLECGENGGTFVCSQHLIRNGYIYKNACQRGYCSSSTGSFLIRPPFERPYKIYKVYDSKSGAGWTISKLAPKCHTAGIDENLESGKDPQTIYSYSLDQDVYVCNSENEEMDSGYRVQALIEAGIIEDDNEELKIFATLSPKYNQEVSTYGSSVFSSEIYNDIRNAVVPTSVAEINIYGDVTDINFVDEHRASEGAQRQKYAQFLSSKIVALNKTADYPIIKDEYSDIIHDYNYLSFWDYLDCTVLQYLTFDINGNGLSDNAVDLIDAVNSENSDKITTTLLSGLWSTIKFIIMVFPFGLLAFIFSIMIAVTMFMMLVRATQQYCACIVNIVIIMYLSPIIFILFMFDATKNAKNVFLKQLKTNIAGCCVPFVSLSIFLFVLDWVMFGDSSKYVEKTMFDSEGINDNCYKGDEKNAPVACLTTRLLNKYKGVFMLWNILTGGGTTYNSETGLLMGFLCLRLLIGIVIFILTGIVSNFLEDKIYEIVGGKPDVKIGAGAEGSVIDAYKAGGQAGLDALKTAGKVYKSPYSIIRGGIDIAKNVKNKFKEKNEDKEENEDKKNPYKDTTNEKTENIKNNRSKNNTSNDNIKRNNNIPKINDTNIPNTSKVARNIDNNDSNATENRDVQKKIGGADSGSLNTSHNNNVSRNIDNNENNDSSDTSHNNDVERNIDNNDTEANNNITNENAQRDKDVKSNLLDTSLNKNVMRNIDNNDTEANNNITNENSQINEVEKDDLLDTNRNNNVMRNIDNNDTEANIEYEMRKKSSNNTTQKQNNKSVDRKQEVIEIIKDENNEPDDG